MGSIDWCRRFSKTAILVLLIHCSDHSPLFLDTNWGYVKRVRLKMFEEMWLKSDEVLQISRKVWAMQFGGVKCL